MEQEISNGLFVTPYEELVNTSWKLLNQQYSLSEKSQIKQMEAKNGN
jgi:hypothetical protein